MESCARTCLDTKYILKHKVMGIFHNIGTTTTRYARFAVPERRCESGKLHFEKTTGYELIRGNPTRLFSDRDGGIIQDCTGRCESDNRCLGFNVDYNRNECQSVSSTSENNLFNLRPSSGVSYFEGICLKGRSCKALWTFERFIGNVHFF